MPSEALAFEMGLQCTMSAPWSGLSGSRVVRSKCLFFEAPGLFVHPAAWTHCGSWKVQSDWRESSAQVDWTWSNWHAIFVSLKLFWSSCINTVSLLLKGNSDGRNGLLFSVLPSEKQLQHVSLLVTKPSVRALQRLLFLWVPSGVGLFWSQSWHLLLRKCVLYIQLVFVECQLWGSHVLNVWEWNSLRASDVN